MKKICKYLVVMILALICALSLAACKNISGNGNIEWGEWTVSLEPTCENDGVEARVSKSNSSLIETRAIAAHGHDWDIWQVIMPPTCLSAGVETRVCMTCGNSDFSPVPALGHEFSA